MFSKNNLARKVETYTGSPLGSVDSGLLKSWSARVGLRHNGLGGGVRILHRNREKSNNFLKNNLAKKACEVSSSGSIFSSFFSHYDPSGYG